MHARPIVLGLVAAAVIAGAAVLVTRSDRRASGGTVPVEAAATAAAASRAGAAAPTPVPPDDVTALLDAAAAGGQARRDAMVALVRLLQAAPARALPVLEAFLTGREADATRDRTRFAVGALAIAGTPEAQAALVRVARAHAADATFAQLAMPSLGFLLAPTAETEAALRGFADGAPPAARKTARLAVGVMAAKLAGSDPARAGAIVADYAGRLASAATPAERRIYLDALGNAGTPDAGAAISAHLADPALRGPALEALRFVRTAEAEAALRGALADGDTEIRARAAWSLSYRTPAPETLRAMLDTLVSDPSERVGAALLDALWPRRAADPAVDAAIRRAAAAHASDKVRARARELLESRGA